MNLNFKNRIAFYFMLAAAFAMAIAFTVIYFAVSQTVFINLDNDLTTEAHKHKAEIRIDGNLISFTSKEEWEEREHKEIQVNPVFIQLLDKQGRIMDKSPNLKGYDLVFKASEFGGHFDSELGERAIRQVQVPLEEDGKIVGYILAAMSSESAKSTLLKLRDVLFISYFAVLFGLYFISRFLASRSIKPVQLVTSTIAHITHNNLKERVVLPPNKDEIYDLSANFNALLERIENTLERERQFTSDASHELRTPLTSLRGTLEVLIRKPREQWEYEEKIRFSLSEIEKMVAILEQLLLLARVDSDAVHEVEHNTVLLPNVVQDVLAHLHHSINEKQVHVTLNFNDTKRLLVPAYCTNLIIENVVGNAIKYSAQDGIIEITIDEIDDRVLCTVRDYGIGIKEEDLKHIYNAFYRSEALGHKHITGNGLGLSIVKKCAEAIKAELKVESIQGVGTTVTIKF